jgi:Holliday junction resolvase
MCLRLFKSEPSFKCVFKLNRLKNTRFNIRVGEWLATTYYTRGRAYEYKALQILRRDGWVCSRSAASHGPVDIFAGKNGRILLIQIKSGRAKVSKADREIFAKWAEAFNADAEIWHFKKRKSLEREVVRVSHVM